MLLIEARLTFAPA